MHEMSLAESVLQIVETAARQQGFSRVTEVRLEIGRLSGVEPEALRFSLEVVFKDSLASAACVELIDIPGRARCLECQAESPVENLYEACPQCGSYHLTLIAGREMRVKDLLAE